MGIELILNASALNFVAFSRFDPGSGAGEITGLFVIVLAVAEAAVALAIVLNFYKQLGSANVDEADLMKG
jgi:NADH-quinone oxidoreductase subunit K